MKRSARETGTWYEENAARYLEQQGYRILEKNFRCRQGEIDLIAMDGEYLCFREVKFRENADCGGPFLAVDNKKQRRICHTALFYLMERGLPEDTACRFDVVGITPDETVLIKDAFLYHI